MLAIEVLILLALVRLGAFCSPCNLGLVLFLVLVLVMQLRLSSSRPRFDARFDHHQVHGMKPRGRSPSIGAGYWCKVRLLMLVKALAVMTPIAHSGARTGTRLRISFGTRHATPSMLVTSLVLMLELITTKS